MVTKNHVVIAGMILAFAAAAHASEASRQMLVQYYNEGVKAQKSGDIFAARAAYQKASLVMGSKRPEVAKAIYNNFGAIHAQVGNIDAAHNAFQAALNIDPNYKLANYNMGVLYASLGHAQEALAYLVRAFNQTGTYAVDSEKPE